MSPAPYHPGMPEARPPSVAPAAAPTPPEAAAEAERIDPLAAELARAVRELRIGQGLSERGAARLLGTSQTQLRRMEDPRYLPSLRSLARLAAAYGRDLRIAFEGRDKPAAKPPAAKPAPKSAPARAPRPRASGKPSSSRQRAKRRGPKTRKRS